VLLCSAIWRQPAAPRKGRPRPLQLHRNMKLCYGAASFIAIRTLPDSGPCAASVKGPLADKRA